LKIYHQPLPSDTLIALYLKRDMQMIVIILAVLKAGAAYVPIDPNNVAALCLKTLSQSCLSAMRNINANSTILLPMSVTKDCCLAAIYLISAELFVGFYCAQTLYLCSEADRENALAIGELIKQHRIEMAVLPQVILSLLDAGTMQS
jgi:hypothetical protein